MGRRTTDRKNKERKAYSNNSAGLVSHFSVSTTCDIPKLLDRLKKVFKALSHLIALGSPVDMLGNHKLITLRHPMSNHVVKITGPQEIIEDFYNVYFAEVKMIIPHNKSYNKFKHDGK